MASKLYSKLRFYKLRFSQLSNSKYNILECFLLLDYKNKILNFKLKKTQPYVMIKMRNLNTGRQG